MRRPEAEIRSREGHWYLKRIRPFHAGRGSTRAGVAITFTDITDRKAAAEALAVVNERVKRSEVALAVELEAMQRLHTFSTAVIDGRDAQVKVIVARVAHRT